MDEVFDTYVETFINDLISSGVKMSKKTAMEMWDRLKTEKFSDVKKNLDKALEDEKHRSFLREKKKFEEQKLVFEMEKNRVKSLRQKRQEPFRPILTKKKSAVEQEPSPSPSPLITSGSDSDLAVEQDSSPSPILTHKKKRRLILSSSDSDDEGGCHETEILSDSD